MPVGRAARFPSPRRRVDRRLPPAVLFGERPWNRGATAVGIVGTILFHLVVILATPRIYVADGFGRKPAPPQEIDLVLTPYEEPETEDLHYVPTNQAAPENRPDQTDAFSARDQQAANEVEAEELSPDRTPARDGEEDLPFENVFTGELDPTLDLLPTPEVPETAAATPQQSETSNPFEQNPLSGIVEENSEDSESTGTSVAESAPNPTPIEERVEGEENPSDDESPTSYAVQPSPERPAPAPRPRLPRAMPGPVSRQIAGVPQVGYVGVDANASRFGEYMERMSEAVQRHWENKSANRVYEPGTRVVVEFDLTRDGAIENLIVREATATGIGVLAVRAALEQGQPFGPWTEDMVTIFGDRETLTFSFYYW